MLREKGFQLEFGGVAGEIYKNKFIQQDYPFYNIEKPNYTLFVKTFFAADYPEWLIGDVIRKHVRNNISIIRDDVQRIKKESKFKTYTSIGHYIMQQKIVKLTNSDYFACANPLMDRNTVALIYGRNPMELEMQRFQRNEISTYCPQLAGILTANRRTCLSDASVIQAERKKFENKNWWYYPTKSIYRRFFNYKKKTRDESYFEAGFNLPEYKLAIDVCKELHIIPGNIDANKIPVAFADRLFTIGLAFERNILTQ